MFTAEIEFPGAGRFSREWLESNPQKLQELLSHCQGQPRCLCKPEGLPLEI